MNFSEINYKKNDIKYNYNHHPNMIAYINIWNKSTFNCDFFKLTDEFVEYLNNKFDEDYEYDGRCDCGCEDYMYAENNYYDSDYDDQPQYGHYNHEEECS